MPLSFLILAAHDRAHPGVTGGDLHLQGIAEELASAGGVVSMWTSRAPGLPSQERVNGVDLRRWNGGALFPLRVRFRGWLHGAQGFDVVLEQVIGSLRLPFRARRWAKERAVGFWYQDNRPLFRAAFRSSLLVAAADRLQKDLLRSYGQGPLLVPSETTRSWLLSQGVPAEGVAVSHPQVALPEGAARTVRPYRERADRFVVIGNFRPIKRFEEAVEVLRRLRQDVPEAEAILLGRPQDPAYLKRLREVALSPELAGHLRIIVGAGEEEKFELLSRSKALTVHSPIEGFGWTVPEAGAMGVPAVVNPGVPHDLDVEGAGLVRVPAGDVDAYVRTLARWMRDEEEWQRASSSAFEGSRKFLQPFVGPEARALLDSVGARKGKAPASHVPPPGDRVGRASPPEARPPAT